MSTVIVKFKEQTIPQVPGAADEFHHQLVTGSDWADFKAQPQFADIEIERLITAVDDARLLELVALARRRNPSYHPPNFFTYFVVSSALNRRPGAIAAVANEMRSRFRQIVDTVYVAGRPGNLPQFNAGQNCAYSRPDTSYLRAAPAGVDAEYAWTQDGGDGGAKLGVNLQFVDLESDWDVNHPDLRGDPTDPRNIDVILLSGDGATREYTDALGMNSKDHGTGALGIVAALNNTIYSVGITPDVSAIKGASIWTANVPNPDPQNDNDWDFDPVNAIFNATKTFQSGDVVLLEIQINRDGYTNLPVEYEQHTFETIQLISTSLDIVFVEAAGNGIYNLDDLVSGWSKPSSIPKPWWLSRNSPQFDESYDSGAIMVSAATWSAGLNPKPDYVHAPIVSGSVRQHNIGSRIDCYAWGDNIFTISCYAIPGNTACDANAGGKQTLWQTFSGTSGASAIIAGCALSVQGLAEKKLGNRLSVLKLRKVLSDPKNGTPSANLDPANPDKIGVMPDLRAIFKMLSPALRIPDLHLRPLPLDRIGPDPAPVVRGSEKSNLTVSGKGRARKGSIRSSTDKRSNASNNQRRTRG